MSNRCLVFDSFSILVSSHWEDVTSSLEQSDAPLTLADPENGSGALQLSPAIYKTGALPHITSDVLLNFLDDFAARKGFVTPFDRVVYQSSLLLVGQSFHSDDDFVRIWYASDGKSVILATYICEWNQRDVERDASETAVQSISFNQ